MSKKIWGLVLGLMMIFGMGSLQAGGAFEGEVDYHLVSKGNHESDMKYLMKKKKIRVEIQSAENSGMQSIVVMDLAVKKMLVLMPKNKIYMENAIPDTKGGSKADGTWTKTGKTDVILGRKAEEWVYKTKKGKVSVWAAPGMGKFLSAQGKPGASDDWTSAIQAKGLFPLKMTYSDNDGNVVTTMTATKVDEKNLADCLFVPPSEYKKMDLNGVMGGPSKRKESSKSKENSGDSEKKDLLSEVKPNLPF